MTTQEFSNTFDTLLNSFNSQAIFGEGASKGDIVLDEYEKSVLLTLALDIIVKSYFSRNGNSQGEGFDDSARRQVDFSELIKVSVPAKAFEGTTYDDRGIMYTMPGDILIPLNERIKSNDGKFYVVVPINYNEYDRLMSKAYALPLKKQAWRLFQGGNAAKVDIKSEIIPIEGTSIEEYKIRYIRRPKPIVLTNLTFESSQLALDIDGVSEVSECELNPIIHMDILNKAVEIALLTRGRMVPLENNKL